MGALKNLVPKKSKAKAGTWLTMLVCPTDNIAADPKTVLELQNGTQGYTPAVGDKVRLGEPFTFLNNAKFSKFDINVDSGELKYETVGERGFEALKNMLSGQIINATSDETREYIEDVTSYRGHVVMIENRDSGDWAVMGSKRHPVQLNVKANSGKKAGDANVVDFDIEDSTGIVYRTYPKALALSVYTDTE